MKQLAFLKGLYADYKEELLRFALRRLGDSDEAEDIVQDAFHNILKQNSPEDLENPRAYLYRATHNLALNKLRKRGRHQRYEAEVWTEEAGPSLERSALASLNLERVNTALNQLPHDTRRAFYLSRIQGLTYPQIAKDMAVSVSRVEKHISAALAFLRKSIEG